MPTPEAYPLVYHEPASRLEHTFILVRKAQRRLELYDGSDEGGTLIGRFAIGLGFSPEGDKVQEGDGRTPEGTYYVCSRNDKSNFYLSLGLSYPSVKDAERGLADGLIDEDTAQGIVQAIENGERPTWRSALGGEIMIHGHGSASDWTAGCIAVDDDVMDILWQHTGKGTVVTILP